MSAPSAPDPSAPSAGVESVMETFAVRLCRRFCRPGHPAARSSEVLACSAEFRDRVERAAEAARAGTTLDAAEWASWTADFSNRHRHYCKWLSHRQLRELLSTTLGCQWHSLNLVADRGVYMGRLPPETPQERANRALTRVRALQCPVCGVVANSETQLRAHVTSRGHYAPPAADPAPPPASPPGRAAVPSPARPAPDPAPPPPPPTSAPRAPVGRCHQPYPLSPTDEGSGPVGPSPAAAPDGFVRPVDYTDFEWDEDYIALGPSVQYLGSDALRAPMPLPTRVSHPVAPSAGASAVGAPPFLGECPPTGAPSATVADSAPHLGPVGEPPEQCAPPPPAASVPWPYLPPSGVPAPGRPPAAPPQHSGFPPELPPDFVPMALPMPAFRRAHPHTSAASASPSPPMPPLASPAPAAPPAPAAAPGLPMAALQYSSPFSAGSASFGVISPACTILSISPLCSLPNTHDHAPGTPYGSFPQAQLAGAGSLGAHYGYAPVQREAAAPGSAVWQ
eukprot:TRINITY_DN4980_c1_g2_i6.p1 TRINITY_DN4980_c1_g2~~TRINITY_DN4980_c1_g2_i6.p1  ORF type:complete len:508 (+),score=67.87 TRINITY_DN4980_c1_g2_i6:141-1664(+)